MAARRSLVFIDLGTKVTNLAAIETACATAITALAAGFFPEQLDNGSDIKVGSDINATIGMNVSKAPYQDWLGVSAAVIKVLDINGYATIAALNAAIDAAVLTQEAASRTCRDMVVRTVNVGGDLKKVLFILFTNGNPATS